MIYIIDKFKYLSLFTNRLESEPIEHELERILNLQSPRIDKNARIQTKDIVVEIDYVLEDRNTICYVEVKKRVNPEAVARFYAAKENILSTPNLSDKKEVFLIVGQELDPVSLKMAERLGIRVEKVSAHLLPHPRHNLNEPFRIKITADKAWKSVMTLFTNQPTSIYNVMKKSGVSYGEAHRVVSYLINRGLTKKSGNFVSIVNFRPILNAVFWERPFSSLLHGSYHIDSELVEDLAHELSALFHESKVKHAFTGFIAYEKYYGGIRSEGALDLYVDFSNSAVIDLIEQFSTKDSNKPNLAIYKPDRDVFSDSKTIDGIQLVSRGQLLLDLSGGDSIAIQYATEMVKSFGKV